MIVNLIELFGGRNIVFIHVFSVCGMLDAIYDTRCGIAPNAGFNVGVNIADSVPTLIQRSLQAEFDCVIGVQCGFLLVCDLVRKVSICGTPLSALTLSARGMSSDSDV